MHALAALGGVVVNIEIVTTITTKVDLVTMKPKHSVDVSCEEEGVPESVVRAAASGACKAALKALEQ